MEKRKKFTDRVLQLPVIKHGDQIGGSGGGGVCWGGGGGRGSENYGHLCVYSIIIQILPLTDWTCNACWRGVQGRNDTKFASFE